MSYDAYLAGLGRDELIAIIQKNKEKLAIVNLCCGQGNHKTQKVETGDYGPGEWCEECGAFRYSDNDQWQIPAVMKRAAL